MRIIMILILVVSTLFSTVNEEYFLGAVDNYEFYCMDGYVYVKIPKEEVQYERYFLPVVNDHINGEHLQCSKYKEWLNYNQTEGK